MQARWSWRSRGEQGEGRAGAVADCLWSHVAVVEGGASEMAFWQSTKLRAGNTGGRLVKRAPVLSQHPHSA